MLALSAIAIAACGGKEPVTPQGGDSDNKQYGDLGIFFDNDDPSVEAGGTISIPFTVTGAEGATLTIEASCVESDCTIKCTHNANWQGNITFTAPPVTPAKNVKVTLTASDSHNRKISKDVTVKVKASDPLTVDPSVSIKSMAVKPGGNFTLEYSTTGLKDATITKVEVTPSSGWQADQTSAGDKVSVTYTAPASPEGNLTIKVKITDSYGRTAECSQTLAIVAISIAENAANSYIVAPGSTITINAVKGNSTQELDLDNAVLVWQDVKGMVKTVSGNGPDKAVVVELNPGLSGNAVVAARKGDKIVWSWHLWITDYDPEEDPFVWTSAATGTTYTYMDRNLGAMSSTKYSPDALGIFYQWGRKDPFPAPNGVESNAMKTIYDIDGNTIWVQTQQRPTYDDHTTTNLQLAIENPLTFYHAPSSAWPVVDWLTDEAILQDDDLWGGTSGGKTIYDPCPEGWTVPASGDGWGFRKEYSKEGKLNDDGKYDPEKAWYIPYDDAECIGFRYKFFDTGKEYWFPLGGNISSQEGMLQSVGGSGQIHTRTVSNTTVNVENIAWGNPASEAGLNRPYGSNVRCVKE